MAEFTAFCHIVCTVYVQYNGKQNTFGFWTIGQTKQDI